MHSMEIREFDQALEPADRDTPTPEGTEVLLKVKAAGVCHTDLHIWHGGYDLGDGVMLKMAERGVSLPHTLGHENVGEVVAFGPDAKGVAKGQVRLVYPWIGCGKCSACQRGEEQHCQQPQYIGVFRKGGYSDHLMVPHPRYLFDIGDIAPESAAPIACSGLTVYSALKKLGSRIEAAPVLVIGAGGLGLMAINILVAMGGKGSIVVDRDSSKRDAALDAGALAAIDPADPDVLAAIAAAGAGSGIDGALDFVGAPQTVKLAMDALSKGGRLIMVGLYGGNITLPLPPIPLRAIGIIGSFTGSRSELQEVLDLFKGGKVDALPIVRRPLACAHQTLMDLEAGKLIGRAILVPDMPNKSE